MKRKLLFAALCVVSVLGLRAQTDVTSTYLTNADFEGDYSVYSNPQSNRAIYQPTGWTVSYSNGDSNDMSALNGDCLQYSDNFAGKPQPSNGGNNTYWIRFRWGSSELLQLTQSVTLPAGQYSLSADAYFNGASSAQATFFAGENTKSVTTTSWTNYTLGFVLAEEKTINIGFKLKQGAAQESIVAFDNFTLTYTAIVVKDILQAAITAATNVNGTLGTLADAITAAQAVCDNESATQDEVNSAAAALNAAVELAMSDAGDVTGVFLTNPGFESCTAEASNVAAITQKDYSSTGWNNASAGSYTTIAVTAYGGGVKVGNSTTPGTKKDGTTVSGNTLGIIAGWGDNVAIQSKDITLPAGVYTLTVDHYLTSSTSNYDNSSSKFGFVTSGSSYLVSSTTFTASTWTTETVTFTLTESTTGKIQIGLTGLNKSGSGSPAVFYDDITITYSSFLAGAKAEWDAAVTAAAAAKTEASTVKGAELTALNAELAKAEPTTVEGYNEATTALEAATATLVAAKPSYDAIIAEIAYAKTLGVATEDAESALAAADATSEKLIAAAQALKVKEYTEVSAAYPNDVTSLLGTWAAGDYATTSGQGYIGGETYFDKWNGSAMDLTSSATATLPAGKYVVKVAGRGVSTTAMSLSVKVGDGEPVSTPFLMKGDLGKGIDTAGKTNFSEEGTYSNDNNGRGWEYRYITFTTDGSAEVTVTVNGHLNAGTWQSFYAPVLLCDDATYAPIELETAKAELQNVIDGAPDAHVANVGKSAFQYDEDAVATYSGALVDAQDAHDATDATVSSIKNAKSTLEAAITAYNALELIAPESTQAYNLVFNCEGHNYTGNALTLIPNPAQSQGLYGLKYLAPANVNLAQAFYFVHTTGNKYKIYAVDTDGNDRYITTQAEGYGTNWYDGIRTITDASKAMEIEIRPNGEGLYLLWNTGADKPMAHNGNDNNDLFTNNTANFQFVKTAKPSITINTTAAGWGTTILPFAVADLPTGVKAYTCAEVSSSTLTLVEVGALEANKPYIIEGAWDETLTGDAQGTALTNTEGLLTGVYADTKAPAGSYVLLNEDAGVGFYRVVADDEPTVTSNHAYLTIASSVKAFFFGDTDAIKTVFDDVANGDIYDMAGRKVSRMQKGGVYVVNGKKVVIK